MADLLGVWDCSNKCGKKGIWATEFNCPGCGTPRSRGVRFYVLPDSPEITPEIRRKLGAKNPNWYCDSCSSGNIAAKSTCWNCGAEKGNAQSHKIVRYKDGQQPHSTEEAIPQGQDTRRHVTTPRKPSPIRSAATPRAITNYVEESEPIEQPAWARILENAPIPDMVRPYISYLLIGFGVLAVVLMLLIVSSILSRTTPNTVRVIGYSWSQNVEVQEYKAYSENSWGTHPTEAYDVKSDMRDTGRDVKVHDGWTEVEYDDTCYRPEDYETTCTESEYVPKTCNGLQDNGDGSFTPYGYECGSNQPVTVPCTKTRQVPYTCPKTRREELFHYEDVIDTYFEYKINRWTTVGNYPTTGNDHEPYFQAVQLQNPYVTGTPQVGQQQKFEQTGKYTVTFGSKKAGIDDFTKVYSLDVWQQFHMDKDYEITVNMFNAVIAYPTP